MKKRINFLIGILALLFTLGAIGKAQDPKPNAEIIKSTEKIVKGQPFSADAISESVQMMFDGNKINRSVKTRMFRDSEGRFRREESAKPVGIGSYVETPSSILILDPVLGVKFVMNPESKTARQSELKDKIKENLLKKRQQEREKRQQEREKEQERQEKERERQEKERQRQKQEREKQEEKRQDKIDQKQDKIDQKIEEVNKKINEKQAEINTKIGTKQPQKAKIPTKPKTSTMPKPSKNSLMPGFPDGEVKNESLGTRKIEGVDAEGIRLTKTFAAGVIGNERSFDIVYERWYSKDLELIVFSKYTDPRFGEQTYKLINIKRAEPDSELFKLPADYTIVNKPSSIEIKPKPPEKRKAEFVYGQ